MMSENLKYNRRKSNWVYEEESAESKKQQSVKWEENQESKGS